MHGASSTGKARDFRREHRLHVQSHGKFIAKFNLPFPLLSDPEKKIVTDLRRLGGEKHVWEEIHGR